MEITDLKLDIPPINNADWDFARTQRVSLRRPQSEWSSSVFSVPVNINSLFGLSQYVVPNRDFEYEGLFSIIDNENWKFLEALPIGIFGGGKWFELKAKTVIASPSKIIYEYDLNEPLSKVTLGTLKAEYYLMQESFGRSVLSVEFNLEPREPLHQKCLLLIDPLVKIRHMYKSANPWDHHVHVKERTVGKKKLRILEVERESKVLSIVTDFEEAQIYEKPREIGWTYTLGDGSREQKREGIFFKRHEEQLLAPATLSFQVSLEKKFSVRLFAICSNGILLTEQIQQEIERLLADRHEETGKMQNILNQFSIDTGNAELDRLLAFRILTLFKFGMNLENFQNGNVIKIPEAGAWWFRTPWLRDVYEGLFNSFSTLLKVPGQKEFIRNIILATAQYQDPESGRVPNKIPEFRTDYETLRKTKRLPDVFYNCVDATLLFIVVTNKFIKATGDRHLASEIGDSFLTVLHCFEKGNRDTIDGQPIIVPETGLLLCVPNHTWTDTQYTLRIGNKEIPNYPLRVPTSWVENNYSNAEEISKELHKPKFYLPEVNAQWILALKSMKEIFDILVEDSSDLRKNKFVHARNQCSMLLEKAMANYKNVFWNTQKGFLFNIVSHDLQLKDPMEGSPALVSVALINEIFSQDELARVWAVVRDSLLVKRKPILFDIDRVAFGVLVKNSHERIYYGDRQYHEAVVWPRDTPYLVKLLMKLNMRKTAEEVLLNTLDHQMSECAVFFNNELFSLAEGQNPYPNGIYSANPVPVKNPIQWWSHWVDPFKDFYGF